MASGSAWQEPVPPAAGPAGATRPGIKSGMIAPSMPASIQLNPTSGLRQPRGRLVPCLLAACLIAACAPAVARLPDLAARPTPTPLIVVAVVGPTLTLPAAPSQIGPPTLAPDGGQGIAATLAGYIPADDPDGAQTAALATLRDFADPAGVYRGAWWFEADGGADMAEVIAVIFFTEANLNVKVQQAIAARYLWYCGGQGAACSGSQLMNFLSYFQPWREPWNAGARFTSPRAQDFLPFAHDLVRQQRGLLTALIPGADSYVRNPDGLDSREPVDWHNTPFHFANVDPTWDAYLRQTLGRGSNGANRLWVLTMAEAQRVCPSAFVCSNMTREKK